MVKLLLNPDKAYGMIYTMINEINDGSINVCQEPTQEEWGVTNRIEQASGSNNMSRGENEEECRFGGHRITENFPLSDSKAQLLI